MVTLETSTVRLKQNLQMEKRSTSADSNTRKQDVEEIDKSVDGVVESDLQWYTHIFNTIEKLLLE